MQLRLIFKEIPLNHIPAYFKEFCIQRDSKSYLTLEAIRKVLMKNPFMLTEEEAELVSRYCTEDNSQEKVEYDETTEVDFALAYRTSDGRVFWDNRFGANYHTVRR